jgi:peptide methionine sulfoxide reductase msrA/msrB
VQVRVLSRAQFYIKRKAGESQLFLYNKTMNTDKVIFAGGCFWCVEHDLREAEGVVGVTSGYTGGDEKTATYMQVASRMTKHREAVEVTYDTEKTNFKKLCQFLLDHIDPTDADGQFHDRGEDYKTAIYFKNAEEKNITENLLKELDESKLYDKPVAVDVLPAMPFYKAEEEHQDYAHKNPEHYNAYRQASGRESFINKTCSIREEKKMNWKE